LIAIIGFDDRSPKHLISSTKDLFAKTWFVIISGIVW